MEWEQGGSVMSFRFDDADVLGLFSIDGYIDATKNTHEQAAELIYKRLKHNRDQVPRANGTARETPSAGIDPAAVPQVGASHRPALKDQICKFLDDTNPEILAPVRSGRRQVCVMFASHRIPELHNLLGIEGARELVGYMSNGGVNIGVGNRVGDCINDLCEGITQGFNLNFIGDW